MKKNIECTIPVFPVTDLKQSITFYTEKLGWKLDWSGEKVCSVSMDGSHLMLSQLIPVTSGSWAWIGLTDDTLFQTYQDRGVKVVQEANNWNWGYEIKFADIDGNTLWFGTATRSDLPVEEG